MLIEETKHDLMLKRIHIALAILGSLIALIIGGYNLKKTMFEKPAPPPPPPPPAESSKLRSALEDVGASWLESLKKKNGQ